MSSIERKILTYGSGSLESWRAFQEGRKRYPGVRHFTIDYSGERAVARPKVLSPPEQEQERLARRLRELRAQEERSRADRLREIERTL